MEQRQQANLTPGGADSRRSTWFGAWAGPALAAALAVVLAFVVGPRPLELGDRATADGALARTVRTALGPRPGTAAIAVAVVTRDAIRTAGLGAAGNADVDENTAFEIGSVTKALTGMVLAEQVADGAVDLDQQVGAVAGGPLEGSGAGGATLRSLAQHRAGYPRLAGSVPSALLGSVRRQFVGGNPYGGWTPERIIDAAADADPDSAGEFAYSNFGYAVLGTALADAADTSYGELLDTRLLQPLGMTATRVVTDATALPDDPARGSTGTGNPRAPWIGAGYAPAGVGVWSTAGDMASLLQAVVRGEAPGGDATQPQTDIADGRRIGLAWITNDRDGRQITWHNGGTGGFSSWVGFDRAAQRGVVVLSASDRRVDQLGLHLLDAAPPPAARGWQLPGLTGLVLLGVLLLAVWTVWSARRRLRRGDTDDRLTVLRPLAEVAALLVIAWSFGPWLEVPWWIWSVVAAVCAVGALISSGACVICP